MSVFVLFTSALLIIDKKLRRAEQFDGGFQLDGKVYEETSYTEIEPYNETYNVVCKTTDGDWTIYEIEQYPDHEYLVARMGWEACVIKLTD